MANLGIKVADVLSKFYDVTEDASIKGLYEIRDKNNPKTEIEWYVFSSNNATYHSSGNDCVIRDINQSNSGYIERLIAAYQKAQSKDIKFFWLVLVFGEGIGLEPAGYDWLASIELRVPFDKMTASLSMRKYPVGKGREGYFGPCIKRIDQDKYFNTTFISCKNEKGDFTNEYLEQYFLIYDNRPYHSTIEIEEGVDKSSDEEERLTGGENKLFYGVPGSGKSFEIDHLIEIDESERVVFHPDYTYSDFVGQILPRLVDDEEQPGKKRLNYVFEAGPFTRMVKKACQNPSQMFYLVIEEINRGNAPAIFGDVFQLLDRDEKGNSKYAISNYDIATEIYNESSRKVRIPSNLSIFATMNTSDQNVFTLDTAFQRRWQMHMIRNNVAAAEHANTHIEGSEVTWGRFAQVVNEEIVSFGTGMGSSEDKRLGAYFVGINELGKEKFSEKVLKYLWDDAFKMDRTVIFDDAMGTLDMVIETANENSLSEDYLKMILRSEIYSKMLTKSKTNNNNDGE